MPAKIVVKDIAKSYSTAKGPLNVVGDINFSVDDGEFVAIVGPSGCGKTTLLNIIAGFVHPDQGQVAVDGEPRDGPSPKGIVISQQGSVFPWLTVRQNLMFGLNGYHPDKKELADRYASMVGLKGFEKGYPHQLSGGMLKRVELARALVVKPEILYMDEPLSALDALTSIQMRIELLRILAEERHTCVLITHDVEERNIGVNAGAEWDIYQGFFLTLSYFQGLNHIGIGQRSDLKEFKYQIFTLTGGFRF